MLRYFSARLIQFVLVVFLGVTLVFLVIRLSPTDPIEVLLNQLTTRGAFMDPRALEDLRETLKGLFGLKGGLFTQYIELWKRLLSMDFGPSFAFFPTPVNELIRVALPWTVGLLSSTTVLAWIIGILLGTMGGYVKGVHSKILELSFMVLRPLPYYVLALVILVLFSYIFPVFPSRGGFSPGMRISFSWSFIKDIVKHSFLPSLSLIITGTASWYQSSRLISVNVCKEDFVGFAEAIGLKKSCIFIKYILKNTLLPQVTGLSLSLGMIFGGALITEMVFSYPGLGTLLYRAIVNSDYNLAIGIIFLSVLSIAFGMLVVDLIYPLIDPRIRYK